MRTIDCPEDVLWAKYREATKVLEKAKACSSRYDDILQYIDKFILEKSRKSI